MKPTNGLDQFGADVLEYKGISFFENTIEIFRCKAECFIVFKRGYFG